MKGLRWTEVIWPLLAARASGPWLTERRPAQAWRAKERAAVATARQASWSDRKPRRLPFDDVQ